MGSGGAGGDCIRKANLKGSIGAIIVIALSLMLLLSGELMGDSYQAYGEYAIDSKNHEYKNYNGYEDFLKYYNKANSLEELKSIEGNIDVLVENLSQPKSGDDFKDELKESELNYEINHEYEDVFNGYSIEIKVKDLIVLFELENVNNVYPVGEVKKKTYGSFPHFNVEEARNLGRGFSLKGQDITVAVLDTGVDFYHRDLGSGFGPGNKVVGGADFVNDQKYPMDDEGHGTHVAGIIAADGKKRGLAPQADILAYKVLDEKGKGKSDNVLAALEEIIVDRRNNEEYAADIINMSFGTTQQFVGELISNALEAATREGIVVVTAAGNNGPGKESLDFPNYSEDVITVGASGKGVNQLEIKASGFSEEITGEKMLYSPGVDTHGAKELVYVENGSNFSDYTDWYGESKVEGKVALARKGPATYKEKADLARRAGAAALIVFDDASSDMLYGSLIEPGNHIPTIGIEGSMGRQLKEAVAERYVEVEFDNESIIPSFSSRGPSEHNTLKPDLVAPGSRVMSTWAYGDYSWAEGTSVSAAFVSGTAALLKQKNPDYSPAEVKAAIMNTALPLEEEGSEYPLTTQGVGELRPYDALVTNTVASPGSISVDQGDLKEGSYRGNRTIKITNSSEEAREYNISVIYNNPSGYYDVAPETNYIRVAGNDQREIGVEFDIGDNLAFGEYSGYIKIEDITSGNTINVPFYFIKELEENLPIIDVDISSKAISEHKDAKIDLEFNQHVDKVNVILKDGEGNTKKDLYEETFYNEDISDEELTITLREGSNLTTGTYFVHVNALPRGKRSGNENNWVESTERIIVDQEVPGIKLVGENVAREPAYELEGKITNNYMENHGAGFELEIEGEKVDINSDGEFSHEIELSEGENKIEFYAKDWANNTNKVTKGIYYKPEGILFFAKGKYLEDISPIIDNNRALIPLKVFESELESEVRWHKEEGKIEILAQGERIKLFEDDNNAIINGKTYKLNTYPRLKEGELYVPVEVASRGLGFRVKWDLELEKLQIKEEATKSISDLPFRRKSDRLMNDLVLRLIFPVSHATGENYIPPGLIFFR